MEFNRRVGGGATAGRDGLLGRAPERRFGDEVDNGLSGGRTFGNDELDRLVSVTTSAYGGGATGLFGGVPAVTYTYDATGNRTSVVSGSNTTAYTLAASPAWNEYASVGGVACTYDSRHCLLTDGARTLNYDADSRLLTATMGSTSVGYTYDWRNHLTTKEVNGNVQRRYVYDGWHVIAEYDGAGQPVICYMQGAGVDEILLQTALGGGGSTTHYLCRDHLGSTMALVNASTGAVDQRFRYEAYGTFSVLTAAGTPASGGTAPLTSYLFTGREWQSEIALYNYRNRFYHPEQGRFCQPDPIGFDGGINVFGYCGAQPASQRDPSGLNPALALECPAIGFEIGLAIGGALVGTAVGVKAIDWLASKITDSDDEYEEPPVRKPSRPSQPAPRNLPKDTRPIDQCPPQRLNGGTPHDIKKWADQGPTDWTGADPNGNIWVDDGNGNGRNLGPFQR